MSDCVWVCAWEYVLDKKGQGFGHTVEAIASHTFSVSDAVLAGSQYEFTKPFSEATAQKIDEEVHGRCYEFLLLLLSDIDFCSLVFVPA